MTFAKYLAVGAISGLVGLGIGLGCGENIGRARQVYTADLNADGKEDVLVTDSPMGWRYNIPNGSSRGATPFIRQEDGTLLRIDYMLNQQTQADEASQERDQQRQEESRLVQESIDALAPK